jgi:hypothetical protein
MKGEHITLSSTNPVLSLRVVNVEEVVLASELDWSELDARIEKDEKAWNEQMQYAGLYSSKWTQAELDTLDRVEARIEAQRREDIGFWHWVYHHVFG